MNTLPKQVLSMNIQEFLEEFDGNVDSVKKNDWRSSTASCRRITLQGTGSDVEILLPGTETNDTAQNMDTLDKQELLKLQETLKIAKERADQLLASLGV
jgi:hypothetical protein